MRFKPACIAIIFVLLIALLGSARAQTPLKITREKTFAHYGEVVPSDIRLFPLERGVGKVFEQLVDQPASLALRLHFRVQAAPVSRSWAVRVLDSARNPLWSYSSLNRNETDFWSDELPKDHLIVEVYSIEKNSLLQLSIDRIAKSSPPVAPKSINPPDQRVNIIGQSAEILRWGRSVARVRFIGDEGIEYYCTGFLVSADLFLTNHHCIKSDSEMRSALVDFDYDATGTPPTVLHFSELVEKDAELDFALLRLAEATDRQALQLDVTAPSENQNLLIIQHPKGEPKQISLLDCRVQGVQTNGVGSQATDFGHLCDTLGGSSGSPVQDLHSGKVIGLHHLGFRSDSGNLFNQAVRIGLIIDLLRTRRPGILTEMGLQ